MIPDRRITKYLEQRYTKVHRNQRHADYLTECKQESLLPRCTYIPKYVLSYTRWNKTTIAQERRRILDKKLQEAQDRLLLVNANFDKKFFEIVSEHDFDSAQINNYKNRIISNVCKTELSRDATRNKKLNLLRQFHRPYSVIEAVKHQYKSQHSYSKVEFN